MSGHYDRQLLSNFVSEIIRISKLPIICCVKLLNLFLTEFMLRCTRNNLLKLHLQIDFKLLFSSRLLVLSRATLLKKRLWHMCFPVNFAKFLRTRFFTEHLWLLLLYYFDFGKSRWYRSVSIVVGVSFWCNYLYFLVLFTKTIYSIYSSFVNSLV